jgi:signal transduction histidine kinase
MTWIHAILQSLAALMISPTVPQSADPNWRGAPKWEAEGKLLVYSAESETIAAQCRATPKAYLAAPMIIQGGHQFFLDGKLVFSNGDRSFQRTHRMYNSAIVPCEVLASGTHLRWEAFTATHSLANLTRFPRVQTGLPLFRFLEDSIYSIMVGVLMVLGILCSLVFYRKVSNAILAALVLGCLTYSIAFVCFVPDNFFLNLHPLTLNRISDTSVWIGLVSSAWLIYLLGYSNLFMLRFIIASNSIGVMIILAAENLDQLQVGSNIAFFGGVTFLFASLKNTRMLSKVGALPRKNKILQILSVSSFALAGIHDTLIFQGIIASSPLFPIGVMSCTALLALAVNEKISETYAERDYLRANLEKEVERKTEALTKQSAELASTLATLKSAQADLVQSAKLAALGTLSAGIAHEINNALNYVNGSIDPLQAILKREALNDVDRSKANKLLSLMKEGLNLTFGIISNLKRHTSTTPGQIEFLSTREAVDGVLLLLKNKLSDVEVVRDIPDGLEVRTQRVSLSQILLNLVGNAIDGIEERANRDQSAERKITISAGPEENGVWISVADTGPGIPVAIQNRIFDPFFTTKAVGKGTGLGLHIVLSEMKKQGGSVELRSSEATGATFILHFKNSQNEVLAA